MSCHYNAIDIDNNIPLLRAGLLLEKFIVIWRGYRTFLALVGAKATSSTCHWSLFQRSEEEEQYWTRL